MVFSLMANPYRIFRYSKQPEPLALHGGIKKVQEKGTGRGLPPYTVPTFVLRKTYEQTAPLARVFSAPQLDIGFPFCRQSTHPLSTHQPPPRRLQRPSRT